MSLSPRADVADIAAVTEGGAALCEEGSDGEAPSAAKGLVASGIVEIQHRVTSCRR